MDYLIEQACKLITQNSTFEAAFGKYQTIEEAADAINKPHEDYPHRVPATIDAINMLIADINASSEALKDYMITPFAIRGIHQMVMADCRHAGQFRNHDVKPEGGTGKEYVPHFLINERLGRITPISVCGFAGMFSNRFYLTPETVEEVDKIELYNNLVLWYKAFQVIHPFVDGNGRVGGIIVAAVSYMTSGEWYGAQQ